MEIRKYSSVGCYPLFYLVNDCEVLCADCAEQEQEEEETIDACAVNWEDPDLYCDKCSTRIESAYAEPDESPQEGSD